MCTFGILRNEGITIARNPSLGCKNEISRSHVEKMGLSFKRISQDSAECRPANVSRNMAFEPKTRPNPVLQGSASQSVLVAIPTFRRSARLRHILPHLTQTLRTKHHIEILIVDNNPLPIERKFVQTFAQHSNTPVHYIHESQPGVSNARNAAVQFASSRFIAFLDDDMEVTENWVDGLVNVSIEHQAGVVFGPLIAKFADAVDPRNTYLSSFYARHSKQTEAGVSSESFGTGGCLIDLETCVLPTPAFDTRLNESGGEDDILFDALRANGTLFGWAPSALCYECVPEARTTSKYVAKRNFGYGQGPSRIAASKGFFGTPQLARHMIVGLGQLGVFGLIYLLAVLANRPSNVRYLALSARSLGKIFWFDKFKPKLYGGAS